LAFGHSFKSFFVKNQICDGQEQSCGKQSYFKEAKAMRQKFFLGALLFLM